MTAGHLVWSREATTEQQRGSRFGSPVPAVPPHRDKKLWALSRGPSVSSDVTAVDEETAEVWNKILRDLDEDLQWTRRLLEWFGYIESARTATTRETAAAVLAGGLVEATRCIVYPLRAIPHSGLSMDGEVCELLWTKKEHRLIVHLYSNGHYDWLHRRKKRPSESGDDLPFRDLDSLYDRVASFW